MSLALIERFAAGGEHLRRALEGLSAKECQQRVEPGLWSIHELVVHVVDSDAVGLDRMKRIIAEERPALLAFDETRFMERLHPHQQSLEDAVLLFEVGRRQMTRVLRELSAEAFQRVGIHSERGPVTLADVIQGFSEHLEHHLEFLRGKRRTLGK